MMVGLRGVYPVSFTLDELGDRESIAKEDLLDRVAADAQARTRRRRRSSHGSPLDPMRQAERFYLLQSIDQHWRQHLDDMEYLREGIHLRGAGARKIRSSSTAPRATRCSPT